jgi:hypothetical protein
MKKTPNPGAAKLRKQLSKKSEVSDFTKGDWNQIISEAALIGRLTTDAQILEFGVGKNLERIWDTWELGVCILRLEEALHLREQIKKLEQPKKRGKK